MVIVVADLVPVFQARQVELKAPNFPQMLRTNYLYVCLYEGYMYVREGVSADSPEGVSADRDDAGRVFQRIVNH
jgi:hypothetical protein